MPQGRSATEQFVAAFPQVPDRGGFEQLYERFRERLSERAGAGG